MTVETSSPVRIEVEADSSHFSASCPGPIATVGPFEVDLPTDGSLRGEWSVTNAGDHPVSVQSIAVVAEVKALGPLRMLRHGYQSWSPSGMAVFGADRDPSVHTASARLARGVHHADPRIARSDELRSEWFTVLADDSNGVVLFGFDGGSEHDGTWRLRLGRDGGVELWAEAWFGGAVLMPGEHRRLHGLEVITHDDVAEVLGTWASRVGTLGHARTDQPFMTGWCSWYQYFDAIDEAALLSNLDAAERRWPFDIFQLDDGYQASIGDWLHTNDSFPSTLEAIARRVRDAGMRPGLWIAPFLVAPESEVARSHPEWLAADAQGRPLRGWFNPAWSPGTDGRMFCLDTTNPEVAGHLERTARGLVDRGFDYLKLDFTFAPSLEGIWANRGATPAQRVRAGFEAIRAGAGEDAFLMGCGVPLANVVGVVDAARIGQDVAPAWTHDGNAPAGYESTLPATRHACASTIARSFMHRRLWLNDPDCVMLRTSDTALSERASLTWARVVGLSGGLVVDSDDLHLLGPDHRRAFDDTVALARASDDAMRRSRLPRLADLMVEREPCDLEMLGVRIVVDPASGDSVMTTSRPARLQPSS